jgi:hypothetical protein
MFPPPIRLGGTGLGQITAPLVVVVVDPRGTPFSGAQVTLQGRAMPEATNSSGIAKFGDVPAGQAVVQVKVGDYLLRAQGSTDQTLFVTVPVCAPGPLLSGTEIVALVLGIAATAGGVVKKYRSLEVLGEIFIGGAIWTSIYRHSCRW